MQEDSSCLCKGYKCT